MRTAALLVLLFLGTAEAALPPGDHSFTLQHGGRERSYIVHVPAGLSAPAPLVVMLHGGGGNASQQKRYSRMDALAEREHFLVAYPNGTGRLQNLLLTWNAGSCCGFSVVENVDDVGFIAAMLDDLAARTPVDARRVYATGMSNGAMMAHRLGAELPDRFAAIAPVAGAIVTRAAPAKPVPVLHIHSVDDPRALYKGGLGPPFPGTDSRQLHTPVEESLARWAKANRCSSGPVEKEVREKEKSSATLLAWQGCAAPLLHWKLTGAGHVWPGTPSRFERLLGPGTDVIDANEEIWKFFRSAARAQP